MIWSALVIALRDIRRHGLRSSLTILGIVIGVFSVITMVTLGAGATQAVKTSVGTLGANVLQVRPGQSAGPGSGSGRDVAPPFKLTDLTAIRQQIGGVTAVAGQSTDQGKAVRNAQNWSTTIDGTTNDYLTAKNWKVVEGRSFTADEERSGRRVCLIGATIVKVLFQAEHPVGAAFRIKGLSCEVVGVLASLGQGTFGNDQDDVVLMPIKAVQRQIAGNQDVGAITIALDPAFDSAAVQVSVAALLRERRGLTQGAPDNFSVLDARQISDTISSTVGSLTALVGAVAGVSLLVGGIGIMNIMLVSVTERTREIGIRLAIGALGGEVLLQFLVEAVALSCLGGLVGMALAFIVCMIAAPVLGLPFLFDARINLVSFSFSAFIGVVFGYFPARRAAALNPIEALRYD